MPSEAEYLCLQIARAKARLRQNARGLSDDVLAPLRLRPFIVGRPWWSLGGATLAGLATGLTLGRRGRGTSAERPAWKSNAILTAISTRVRRVLTSVVGAAIVANVRGATPPANEHALFSGDLDGPVSGP